MASSSVGRASGFGSDGRRFESFLARKERIALDTHRINNHVLMGQQRSNEIGIDWVPKVFDYWSWNFTEEAGDVTIPLQRGNIGEWLAHLLGEPRPVGNPILGGTIVPKGCTYELGEKLVPEDAQQPHQLISDPLVDTGRVAIKFKDADGVGFVEIKGKDCLDRSIGETIQCENGTLGRGDGQRTESDYYYKRIDYIQPSGAVNGGTWSVACRPNVTKFRLHAQPYKPSRLVLGLTKNGATCLYTNINVREGHLNFGDALSFTFQCECLALDNDTAIDTTRFARIKPDLILYPNYSTLLMIDGEPFPIADVKFHVKTRQRSQPAVRLVATVDAPQLEKAALGPEVDVTLSFGDFGVGEAPSIVTFEMPNAKLARVPDTSDDDAGLPTRDIEITAHEMDAVLITPEPHGIMDFTSTLASAR